MEVYDIYLVAILKSVGLTTISCFLLTAIFVVVGYVYTNVKILPNTTIQQLVYSIANIRKMSKDWTKEEKAEYYKITDDMLKKVRERIKKDNPAF